jgi:energy-coupling factor transport system ATP-binding protein
MEPDLLLLDEPTKGMDGSFKKKFSRYLRELSQKGMTILLVTHDLEFCARNATRCGFLFDGTLLSEGETKSFFEDSTFYTTQARRMTEGLLPHCILWEDIVEKL